MKIYRETAKNQQILWDRGFKERTTCRYDNLGRNIKWWQSKGFDIRILKSLPMRSYLHGDLYTLWVKKKRR